MLVELMVRDLGVIEASRLVLEPGMTAVTGETGAGKTMLVEAISLLVGQRADPSRVRIGADEARVEGRFEVDGEEVVVARVVPRSGRSRAYVNGRLATAGELAALGARSIDVHGQHAHQSLLAPAVQRSALDHYGGVDLEPYREALALVSRLTAELEGLGGDERARAREMDMVRFQVAEIDDVAVTGPEEDDLLKQREAVLADADGHKIASEAAVAALVDEGGVIDGVAAAVAATQDRAPFVAAHDRLRSLQAEVDDVARDLRDLAEQTEADPGALAEVQERRRQLAEIRRKYGADLEAVLAFADDARRRLDELERHDQHAEEVAAALRTAQGRLADAAAAVAAQRREVAPRLARGVQRRFRDLAMPNATVGVEVEGPDPADGVHFQLAADGGTLHRLTKVASGGELARAMLALRLVLSEAPDTLLFDEVDSGIGGAAASAVGRALADLGTRHQVLVVTHLPQVAACADHHLVVEKLGKAGSVKTSIDAVVDDERVTELSRMLSGSPDSESARRHAAELLGTGGKRRVMSPADTSLGDPSSRLPPEVVTGRVRSGHNTIALIRRLHSGEIAVIDHADIDRETAQALAAQRVAAVVNASDSITGRFPHDGPLALVERGIPLVDGVGEEIFSRLHDGLQIAIVGNHILLGDERVATGRRQTPVTVRARMEVAERGLDDQIGLFAAGALEYLRDQDVSLTQLSDLPDLELSLRDRQVLVVASGLDDQDDLAVLRGSGYIQEQRPYIIGVDTGADVLLDQGVQPDLVIGELTDVSDRALQAASVIIAHGHGEDEPAGMARLAMNEVEHHRLAFDGSSMDAAMLLAQDRGADLIVAVGSHPSLDDFLGQDRALIATRMVTRLRVGHILVDARGVSRIYRREVRKRDLMLLVGAAVFTLIVLFIVSEPLRLIVRGFRLTF